MKSLIFGFLLLVSISANASISCSIKDFALNNIPSGVSAFLECKNTPAIKEDMAKMLDYLGVCTDPRDFISLSDKGFWGILCKEFVPGLIDYSVDYILPDKWECSATNFKQALTTIALKQCDSI